VRESKTETTYALSRRKTRIHAHGRSGWGDNHVHVSARSYEPVLLRRRNATEVFRTRDRSRAFVRKADVFSIPLMNISVDARAIATDIFVRV
jgi:hypothetical protein